MQHGIVANMALRTKGEVTVVFALDSALAPVLDPLSNLPNGETRKSTIADDTSVN